MLNLRQTLAQAFVLADETSLYHTYPISLYFALSPPYEEG
jgi:hypothetical protein